MGESGSATGTKTETLILRWNGTSWKQVPSPTPAGGATLYGVAVTLAGSAWAVGWAYRGSKTLILHWNGTAGRGCPARPRKRRTPYWRGGDIGIQRVGGRLRLHNPRARTLILRWNGAAWTRVPSPDPRAARRSRRRGDLRVKSVGGRLQRLRQR